MPIFVVLLTGRQDSHQEAQYGDPFWLLFSTDDACTLRADTFETQIMQLQDFKLRVAQEVIPDSAGKADQRGITDEILSSWITSIQERHCDVHKNKPSLSLPALRASMMKESSSRSNAAEAA